MTATTCDQIQPSAKHWYDVPGDHGVSIVIWPQELGITGAWARWCRRCTIQTSELVSEMDRYDQECQMDGLAT